MTVILGYLIDITFSEILSFSALLLKKPLEDMFHQNEEENKNSKIQDSGDKESNIRKRSRHSKDPSLSSRLR